MTPELYVRCILSCDTGASVVHGQQGVYAESDFGGNFNLAEPFEKVRVLPAVAGFRGEIIGAIAGESWAEVDRRLPSIQQIAPDPTDITDTGHTTEPDTIETHSIGEALQESRTTHAGSDQDPTPVPEAYEIVEGLYRTGLQLHMSDTRLWVEAVPVENGISLTLPCQWPGHVRTSVAAALRFPESRIQLTCHAPSGNRDGALVIPSALAIIASLIAIKKRVSVRIALREDQSYITGGRAPARIQWASRLGEDGTLLSSTVTARLNLGAYPILRDETVERLRTAVGSVYSLGKVQLDSHLSTTPDIPMGLFEGTGTAQITFAREVHWNRLAEIAEEDPIDWRKRHLPKDWPVVADVCDELAEEADFHRRYGANELVRKRRSQLPRDTAALRGIGCALSVAQSGFIGNKEKGAITVRLNQDGTANLFCSIPTPTLRLQAAWQQLIAQELGIEREAVVLETEHVSKENDSGPRLFSRGVSLVPRAIVSACQAIQKQRFREPLPISVRRTLKAGRTGRSPIDALQSIGGAAVEAVLIPARMEIDVRSVTMVVYAGRILDKGMAEAELRRGIYHALNWSLNESLLDAELIPEPAVLKRYNTAFRGAVPLIKVVFLNQRRKDGPTGIGELPFNTIPAALVSALTQATGLYLDSLPVEPADMLRMLQED